MWVIRVPFAPQHSIYNWSIMDPNSQQPRQNTAAEELLMVQKQNAALIEDQLVGRKLQQRLRPDTPWHAQGLTFQHCVIPALYLAGDTLDYFSLPDGRILLYLADVSGSGTAAALITLLLKSTVNDFVSAEQSAEATASITPAALLTHLNQRLLTYSMDRHVTLICAIVDTQHELLQWSVAGHLPSPILYSDGQAAFLTGKGLPVGLFAHASYSNEQVQLPHGFSLCLLSDGVFDAQPQDSLVSSETALPALINAAQGEFAQIVQRLGLANCSNMPDDIALLVLSRNLT